MKPKCRSLPVRSLITGEAFRGVTFGALLRDLGRVDGNHTAFALAPSHSGPFIDDGIFVVAANPKRL